MTQTVHLEGKGGVWSAAGALRGCRVPQWRRVPRCGLLVFLAGWLLVGGFAQELREPMDLPELDAVTDLDALAPDDPLVEEAAGFDLPVGEGGLELEEVNRDPQFEQQLRDAAERDGWGLASEAELAARAARAASVVSNPEMKLVVIAPRRLARSLLELTVQTRRHFIATLGPGTGEPLPCVVRYVPLPAEAGEPVTLVRLVMVEGLGWRAELAIRPGAGLDERALRLAVVEMLFQERMARGFGELPPTGPVVVPPWLARGTLVLMERLARWQDHRLAAGLLRRGRLPKLATVLEDGGARLPGEAEERELASAALVLALRGPKPGEGGFDGWVRALATPSESPLQQLVLHFVPGDLGVEELERRYAAALKSLADAGPFDRLGVAESRDALRRWMTWTEEVPAAADAEADAGAGDAPDAAAGEIQLPLRTRSVAEILAEEMPPGEAVILRWLQILDALRERVNPLYGSTVARQYQILRRLGRGELELPQARVEWAREVEEMDAIDELLQAMASRLDEFQINHGRGDARWMAQLTQAQRETDLRPLLEPRGVLAQRLERAEWALDLRQRDEGRAETGEEVQATHGQPQGDTDGEKPGESAGGNAAGAAGAGEADPTREEEGGREESGRDGAGREGAGGGS